MAGFQVSTEAAPTRVVSTTTVPLFQHVAAGLFLDDLYYRLNTVMLYGAESVMDGADNPRPQLANADLGTGKRSLKADLQDAGACHAVDQLRH